MAMRADDDHDKDHRYYDRDAKDYHAWNAQEERAYRHYLEERREQYRAWNKLKREEQREYWKWRHSHPDWDRDHDRH
jgi:hypothetical protein